MPRSKTWTIPLPGLKRAQIDQLRASQWVQHQRNCSHHRSHRIGQNSPGLCPRPPSVPRRFTALSTSTRPNSFRALETARADGSLFGFLKTLARTALVVIDDLGIATVSGKLYREFLEMLDDRHGQGATLITSQFPVNQWHELIGDATVADAILDRLVHNAYRLELKGESRRKDKTLPSENRG